MILRLPLHFLLKLGLKKSPLFLLKSEALKVSKFIFFYTMIVSIYGYLWINLWIFIEIYRSAQYLFCPAAGRRIACRIKM